MNSPEIIEILKKKLPLIQDEKVPSGFIQTLDMMFKGDSYIIDRERLNILLSYWDLPPMEKAFFNKYCEHHISTILQFESSLDEFIKDALWHFGDLKRGYEILSKHTDINQFIKKHEFDVQEFKDRLPWHLVEPIEPSERGFLGYVSGQRPKQQQELLGFAELVIKEIENNNSSYNSLSTDEITEKVLTKLSARDPLIKEKIDDFNRLNGRKDLDLFSAADLETSKNILLQLRSEIEKTIEKVDGLKEIGKRNQEHYLRNIESIDVYVATSMRNDDEYLDMYNFVQKTFDDENVKSLNIRYFDPTLCFCDSRIDKGIIECLLVRSTKVTIYCAQEGDTFGKDSELAATMSQGKPVIVYVPLAKETDHDIINIKDSDDRKRKLNKKQKDLDARAKTFKDFHPLGLQVGLYDGVARGVIVVRTPDECAKILYNTLTNSLEVDIHYEQHGIVLREKETNSIVRVMTGWNVLASCFWNQFNKTQYPKAGLPD